MKSRRTVASCSRLALVLGPWRASKYDRRQLVELTRMGFDRWIRKLDILRLLRLLAAFSLYSRGFHARGLNGIEWHGLMKMNDDEARPDISWLRRVTVFTRRSGSHGRMSFARNAGQVGLSLRQNLARTTLEFMIICGEC